MAEILRKVDEIDASHKNATAYMEVAEQLSAMRQYPRSEAKYKVGIDVASGQKITGLSLADTIPPQYAYLAVTGAGLNGAAIAVNTLGAPSTPVAGVPHAGPSDNQLVRTFPGTVTGSAATDDAYVVIQYFVPDNDPTPTPIVDHTSGDDVPTTNFAKATGTIKFLDTRDADAPLNADSATQSRQSCPPG